MKTYKLHTIQDLLSVPADRRADCLREIEIVLSLHEFAFGEDAATTEIKDFHWTDDGDKSVSVMDQDSKAILSLQVVKS